MAQRPILTKEQLKHKLQVSNFHPDAILRGAQLTIVGVTLCQPRQPTDTNISALRALQNPKLFTSEHYKQAAIAVAAGIAIRLLISIPTGPALTCGFAQIIGIKVLLWFLSFILDFEHVTWDNDIVKGLDFIQKYVLQVPFFLMTMMRYVTPTLDNILAWVDKTYYAKHEGEAPSTLREAYYPNLRMYATRDGSTHTVSKAEAVTMFMVKFGKKCGGVTNYGTFYQHSLTQSNFQAGISLTIFALSYIPYIGRFVLPAASFYTFNKVVGLGPAAVVFGTGLFLPRRYLVIFLQSYFASRSLMRELLEPYFSRIKFTKEQKKHWFHDREGLLFGFGVGFYIFLRIPLLGVLIYGIAEASTAYLITKVTDPPPSPANSEGFAASQQEWKNKHEFLNLKFSDLDTHTTTPNRSDQGQDQDHDHDTVETQGSSSGLPAGAPPSYTEMRSR
ncbi:hypothetical protein LOCC1_G007018 [Lachnellula occidentalis]|uniref:Transmembrane protein UsgS n=1 Tax=Lachnellula occidentalis TaxID=215460 RepID=A0A8H8RJ01_9HELO|nr:hypothetical protein LOCC1_G007018 [Lachnellula occidentalis]